MKVFLRRVDVATNKAICVEVGEKPAAFGRGVLVDIGDTSISREQLELRLIDSHLILKCKRK